MGVNAEQLRTDGKAGSVDLSILAGGEAERIKSIGLRTVSGLWYSLSPLEETTLQADGIITPVHLEFNRSTRIGGNFIEEAGLALKCVRRWVTEQRHFPHYGEVAVANAVILEGDCLTINGRDTSPIDVAWVTEYVDDHEGAPVSTYNFKTNEWTSWRPFAHF